MDFNFHPTVPKPKTHVEKALIRRERLRRNNEDWIHGGNIYDRKKPSSITLGIVPGVVVEERRLGHMLNELARQRHQYTSQHEYSKKMFFDKQMNKSEELRRAIVHESLTRGWSVAAGNDVSFDDSSEGLSVTHGYVPKGSEKNILSKSRLNLLDIKEKKKKNDTNSSNGIEWFTLPPIEDKTSRQGTYIKTVKFDSTVNHSSPRHSARSSFPRDNTLDRFPGIHRERSKSLPYDFLVPWGSMRSTNIQPGKCLPPVSKDRRFSHLESLLENTYHGSKRLQTVKVPEIIENCNSLYVPATDHKKEKRKVEDHIRRFLIKMGIAR